jgi:hypothetical protein
VQGSCLTELPVPLCTAHRCDEGPPTPPKYRHSVVTRICSSHLLDILVTWGYLTTQIRKVWFYSVWYTIPRHQRVNALYSILRMKKLHIVYGELGLYSVTTILHTPGLIAIFTVLHTPGRKKNRGRSKWGKFHI